MDGMKMAYAARLVPLSIALTCAAAMVQHRVVLGVATGGWVAYALPIVIGAAFGLLLAWTMSARDRMREAARFDVLTGLLNRAAFDRALVDETARASRYGSPFGVLLFDVDHFKTVNDTYGHDAGDAVLRTIAHLARGAVRETDKLSRWGGDEMALVAPSTGLPGARVLAEKIRTAVATHEFGLPGIEITVSVGLAQFVEGDDAATLLKRADEALYRAKRNGRNCSATMRCLRPAIVHSRRRG